MNREYKNKRARKVQANLPFRSFLAIFAVNNEIEYATRIYQSGSGHTFGQRS